MTSDNAERGKKVMKNFKCLVAGFILGVLTIIALNTMNAVIVVQVQPTSLHNLTMLLED